MAWEGMNDGEGLPRLRFNVWRTWLPYLPGKSALPKMPAANRERPEAGHPQTEGLTESKRDKP